MNRIWLWLAIGLPLLLSEYVLQQHSVTLILSLLFILMLGVPHGALDIALARCYLNLSSTSRVAIFFAAYVGLAALIVIVWLWQPNLMLALFLLYSAYHFADDWRKREAPVFAFAGAIAVLGFPALFRSDEVTQIFGMLGASSTVHSSFLAIAALPAALLVAFGAIRQRPYAGTGFLAPLLALMATAWMLPPIAYFAVYFCVLHAPNHHEKVAHTLGLRHPWRQAAAPTVAIIVAQCLAFWGLHSLGLSTEAAAFQVVFIGLAALTVPHMLLVERFLGAGQGTSQ